MTWIDVLTDSGGKVWATRQHVAVQDVEGRSHDPVPLVRWHRYVRPADIARLPAGAMVVADRVTRTAVGELTGRNWWAATMDGTCSVAGMRSATPHPTDPMAHRQPAPLDVQLAGLVLAAPDRPHHFYAAALAVSRVRVTQLFGLLRTADRAVDANALRARWADADPRTAGHVTRWKGAGSAWEQAAAAYGWLDEQRCQPVLGGEVAADAIRPWRSPGSSVLHVRKLTPPPPGFVIADSPATATVTVVVDHVPAVAAVATMVRTPIGDVRIAQSRHVAQDLADAAEHDDRVALHRRLLLDWEMEPTS
jgi:hypothetical protein